MPNLTAPLLFANRPRLSDTFMALARPNLIGSLERASSRFGMATNLRLHGVADRIARYTHYKNQAVFNQNASSLPDIFDPMHSSKKRLTLKAVMNQLKNAYDHLPLAPKNALITALADPIFLRTGLNLTSSPILDPLALLQSRTPAPSDLAVLVAAQTLHDGLHYSIDHESTTAKVIHDMAQATGALLVNEKTAKYGAHGYLCIHFSQGFPVLAFPHPVLDNTWTVQKSPTFVDNNHDLPLLLHAASQVNDVKTRLSQAGYSIVD